MGLSAPPDDADRGTAEAAQDAAQAEAREAAQIEQLLAELRELVALPVWQRIEDLVRRIVRLYAAGIARALEHGRRAGADGAALDDHIVADELLAGLLALHGLHPRCTEDRVRAALAQVRAALAASEDALALAEIADGVVRVVTRADLGGGAMAPSLAETIVRHAIEAAAPEILAVEIAGLPVPRDPSLVQLRTRRTP